VLNECNVKHEFYSINLTFEPVKEYRLQSDEAFLYTNYFGLTNETTIKLAGVYGSQLIVDNSLAFYEKPIAEIDTFYSTRKFFGVPDGAYLYTDTLLNGDIEQDCGSYNRMIHLVKRIDVSIEASRADFNDIEKKLDNEPIKRMSKLTEKLSMGIDYETIKNRRIENYLYLDASLKADNLLKIGYPQNAVPMIYPLLCVNEHLRDGLIKNKMYPTTFWSNVYDWCNSTHTEYFLSKNIIAFPIVQKYDRDDMEQMLKIYRSVV